MDTFSWLVVSALVALLLGIVLMQMGSKSSEDPEQVKKNNMLKIAAYILLALAVVLGGWALYSSMGKKKSEMWGGKGYMGCGTMYGNMCGGGY